MTNDDEDAYFYAHGKIWRTLEIRKDCGRDCEPNSNVPEIFKCITVRAQMFNVNTSAYEIPYGGSGGDIESSKIGI
jgi:hypothetical protein